PPAANLTSQPDLSRCCSAGARCRMPAGPAVGAGEPGETMDRMFKRLGLLPLALFAPVAAAAEQALPAASTLPLDFSRPLEIGVEVQGMDAEARVNELSQYLDQQGFELRLKLDYRI